MVSFCLNSEALYRRVVVLNVESKNSPSSFRSGYIPSILELLNLIVSAGFFNYFSSHPVTDLQNVLEEVLDPTNARQTELYFHVIIEHARQFWIVCSNPRVSTCCWGFPRTSTVAVSSLTSVLLLPYDMECSLSDFCGCYRKAFGTAFFHPRSPMRTAMGLCELHGL